MTTIRALQASDPVHRRRIAGWDIGVTIVCLALAGLVAFWLTALTGFFGMAADVCEPGSPCMAEVDRGINISLGGMSVVVLLGLVCVLVAAMTRTKMFVRALLTVLLVPVPCYIGSTIADHAMYLSRN